MGLALLESSLVAYCLGALLGLAALFAEYFWGFPASVPAAAGYSLAGGTLACVARGVFGLARPRRQARGSLLVALAGFAVLHLLYFLNARLLPGEPYHSPTSLLGDVLVVALAPLPLVWLARSPLAGWVREVWGSGVAISGAVLLAGGLVVAAFAWHAPAPDPSRPGTGPNLLLIVLDSARRDHLGLHGYHRPTTPSIDALGARARIYETAYAGSSWTVPSVATMLWSRLGPADPGAPASLQERLAARGYATACFTDNPHMGQGSELVRGFDRVERSVGEGRRLFRRTVLGEVIERLDPGDDERLLGRALAWAQRQPGPLFLYAHLMDSHTPYRSAPIDGRRRKGRRIEFPFTGMETTPEEAEDIVARYDGGIRRADAQVGRLLAAAPAWGRPFLAIITADHGESMGESSRWFHGNTLAPELLAVPLIVVGEAVAPGRVNGVVGHASIPRTLLAAAGVPCGECPSADLRAGEGPGVADGGLPPQLAYRIAWGFKLVLDRRDGHRRLFDLRADPAETRDLAPVRLDLAEALAAGLTTVGHALPSAEEVERLRSLGYVGS